MTSDRHNHSDTKQANCQIKSRLVQIIARLHAPEERRQPLSPIPPPDGQSRPST
jgi:hypothetical protein